MKPRTFVAIAALLAAVVAVILLTTTVNATTTGGRSVACGNGFTTDMGKAVSDSNVNSLGGGDESYSGFQAACDSALSTRRGFGWGLLAVGVLVFVGVLVVRRPEQAGTPPTAAA